VDHVVINCRDVDATARWYAEVLGMEISKFGLDGRTALHFGQQKINLRPLSASSEMWPTGVEVAAGSTDLCFVTQDSVADVLRHLDSCGISILEGPVDRQGALGRMTSVYCRDPDGNLLEIAAYPGG
jgi:catechol 2,3-dioxygenase-like lactoylglutathione lyase family enzyme